MAGEPETKKYTVQCDYNTSWTNTVVVEASSPEEAAKKAIDVANEGGCWDSADWCGDTYVEQMREGEHDTAWGGTKEEQVGVPDGFTEKDLYLNAAEQDAGEMLAILQEIAAHDECLLYEDDPLKERINALAAKHAKKETQNAA